VQRRLTNLGIDSCIVPDTQAGADATEPIRVRALEIDDAGIYAFQTPETPTIRVLWPDIILLVVGMLSVKRVELKEQKGKRAENRILDSSEFATDERVLDFYTSAQANTYRIKAYSFDFSCLAEKKGLVASENFSTLVKVIRERAPQAEYDDSYNSVRKALDAVWAPEQQNETSGWRRERPGKYSIGTVTELSNEIQFLRYSRVRYHLALEKLTKTNDYA
jgi:hypothetical protein